MNKTGNGLRKKLLTLATPQMTKLREWEYGHLWEQRGSELQSKVDGGDTEAQYLRRVQHC